MLAQPADFAMDQIDFAAKLAIGGRDRRRFSAKCVPLATDPGRGRGPVILGTGGIRYRIVGE